MVPVAARPPWHPFFRASFDKYRIAFPECNEGFEFDWRLCERDFSGERLDRIAKARNALLDDHLDDSHDLVLIVDSDVIMLPFDLPSRLHSANPGGITAPLVLIEGVDEFYDTRGFITADGVKFDRDPPFVPGTVASDLVAMEAVGTCYLAPASLFRDGVRFKPLAGYDTDHVHVCHEAAARGLEVRCLSTVAVYHAHLPLYGEAWH